MRIHVTTEVQFIGKLRRNHPEINEQQYPLQVKVAAATSPQSSTTEKQSQQEHFITPMTVVYSDQTMSAITMTTTNVEERTCRKVKQQRGSSRQTTRRHGRVQSIFTIYERRKKASQDSVTSQISRRCP